MMKPISADFSGFSIMPVTRGNDTMKIETNPPPFFFLFQANIKQRVVRAASSSPRRPRRLPPLRPFVSPLFFY
jgi:hypothetical protein